ncbi:hypothetical protein [Ferrimonas kyonanensis]|uniref:hypothetical protein n=1 Tax=Ferrimonas kyonanensis TaxID=364763 RepID=UPI00042812C6|nr:hypothetical protein [Ferrimonas kyonanensis]
MGKVENLPVDIQSMASLKHWGEPPKLPKSVMKSRARVHCGWGRVLFGHTFADHQALIKHLSEEDLSQSDVVFYCREPQILVSKAPHKLFIDPSLTYRLDLSDPKPEAFESSRLRIRPMMGSWDEYNLNKLLLDLGRVDLGEDFTHRMFAEPALSVLIAEDEETGQLLGCVFGIDHKLAFDDPENGASAWSLAVIKNPPVTGVAIGLMAKLAKQFGTKGRNFLDWSIVHDELDDCSLAEQMGFVRVPVYSVKNRNAVNEPLFTSEAECEFSSLSSNTHSLVDQARRLGISVQINDASRELFSLKWAGQSVLCMGSLSELTSAVALESCQDRQVSNSLLKSFDVAVPTQRLLSSITELLTLLETFRSIDLLPAADIDNEQGLFGLKTEAELEEAWHLVKSSKTSWVARESIFGQELDVLVIGNDVFAAKVGERLIESGEQHPHQATSVKSTSRIEDVTERLHPVIKRAALLASQALGLSIISLKVTVASECQPDYKVTSANPRPNFSSFAPQPVVEHWLKFLFPTLTSAIDTRRDL